MVFKICIDRLKKIPRSGWRENLKIPHYSPKKKNALHIIGLKKHQFVRLMSCSKTRHTKSKPRLDRPIQKKTLMSLTPNT